MEPVFNILLYIIKFFIYDTGLSVRGTEEGVVLLKLSPVWGLCTCFQADEYRFNKPEYIRKAKEWTRKHAFQNTWRETLQQWKDASLQHLQRNFYFKIKFVGRKKKTVVGSCLSKKVITCFYVPDVILRMLQVGQ